MFYIGGVLGYVKKKLKYDIIIHARVVIWQNMEEKEIISLHISGVLD